MPVDAHSNNTAEITDLFLQGLPFATAVVAGRDFIRRTDTYDALADSLALTLDDLDSFIEAVHRKDKHLCHCIADPDTSLPTSFKVRVVNSANTVFSLRIQLFEIDMLGERIRIIGLQDISDHAREFEALQESSHLYRASFSMSPDLMCVSRLSDGIITEVNPAFINLLGYRRDDLIGHGLDELNIWTDPMFITRFSSELKMTSSLTDVPTSIRSRGGVIRHIRLSAQKVDRVNVPMLLMIGRDVTEEIHHAQELQKSRDTAELANRTKSEFLANMSHELRTPLNAILGFAEIIKDEMLGVISPEKYKDYAADIHDSGGHLLSIINDILDLSKVEAGRLETHLQWIEPIDAIESSLSFVRQTAQQNHLQLSCDVDDSLILEADERLIKQICVNLLSNATKFTEPGGIITLKFAKTPNGGACLSVEDTGIGMTADEIRIARRPFGQVENAMITTHHGSGLGLPIVKAFVEKMHATMIIDSTPKVGTKVSIFFQPAKVNIRSENPEDAEETTYI